MVGLACIALHCIALQEKDQLGKCLSALSPKEAIIDKILSVPKLVSLIRRKLGPSMLVVMAPQQDQNDDDEEERQPQRNSGGGGGHHESNVRGIDPIRSVDDGACANTTSTRRRGKTQQLGVLRCCVFLPGSVI